MVLHDDDIEEWHCKSRPVPQAIAEKVATSIPPTHTSTSTLHHHHLYVYPSAATTTLRCHHHTTALSMGEGSERIQLLKNWC